MNLATSVLGPRLVMENWGLVFFFFLMGANSPLLCRTLPLLKTHSPNLPFRIAYGCISAEKPNPNHSFEGGRPQV